MRTWLITIMIGAAVSGGCARLAVRNEALPAIASSARPANGEVIALWPESVSGTGDKQSKAQSTMTAYLPESDRATAASVVICPGGGYTDLCPREGEQYAHFLAEQGIAGFVLKYRLASGGYHYPAMLEDAARAVRLIRANAREWKLDPKKIGIMGSSAGGHLAATLMTHFDGGNTAATDAVERQSSRPDLGILCYPVITMAKFTNPGTKANLLGTAPSIELVWDLSDEVQVTQSTPPCFIWSTYEDQAVPMENTMKFAAALRKSGVPFDLHIYQKGAHGLGLGSPEYDPSKRHPWTKDCLFWLKSQGFLTNEKPAVELASAPPVPVARQQAAARITPVPPRTINPQAVPVSQPRREPIVRGSVSSLTVASLPHGAEPRTGSFTTKINPQPVPVSQPRPEVFVRGGVSSLTLASLPHGAQPRIGSFPPRLHPNGLPPPVRALKYEPARFVSQ